MEIHSSARKHGVADEDIEHAIDNAMSIDDQDDDTRLYLDETDSGLDIDALRTVAGAGS